ncbi:hypothetical protein [Salipiger mangrovisoli]|uniref:Uncharacterized protein n=1 Tax=Salipiger mangrovisoli TaxID=2865933 RepID=A0ABR9XBB9_9RHOB|nr:hypothetical protein [Salipiger mangrovisoli]MBE9640920.1 hypothetical protein [Salipiger mangrovisoli]
MAKEIEVLEVGEVRFLTTHRTLALVARTLSASLATVSERFGPTDIWLGAHRTRRVPRTAGRRLVVVQTEQILDAGGQTIETKLTRRRIARLALQADLFVEWNPQNRAFYGLLPRLLPRRFLFGPYVFPLGARKQAAGEGLVFVGNVTPERQAKLARLPDVRVLPMKAGIDEIDRSIAAGAAMLNLHSLPGAYTEVPRVLMAYLAGKPLVSEALAPPFAAGRSYLLPEAPRGPEALAQAWQGLGAVAARYPITGMLRAGAGRTGG